MAKLLLLLSLSVLYLISINHSSSASVVPDQRDFEFEPIDRRIHEMRLDNNEEQENDDDEDDIMDAKELNQHLKVVHKKPNYNIFNEKVTQTLITEADKAVAKIKVLIGNNKNNHASGQGEENFEGSKGNSNGGNSENGQQSGCTSFAKLSQAFTKLLTNYSAARSVALQAKKTKNEALIRYKVYYNLHQQFCTSGNSSICNSISISMTAENNKYTKAADIIKAATRKLLEFGLKLLNIGESIAKCFHL